MFSCRAYVNIYFIYQVFANDIHQIPNNLKRNGLWSCTNEQKCISLADCTKKQAEYRAGYLCDNYPWYNGGPPILSGPKFDSLDTTISNCTHNHGTGCKQWSYSSSIDHDSKQLLIGGCYCNSFLKDYACNQWLCEDYSMNTCTYNYAYDCGNYIDIDSNTGYYDQCCKEDLNNGVTYYKNKHIHKNSRNCICTKTEQNFVFLSQEKITTCIQWNCITSGTSSSSSSSNSNTQYQNNTCDQLSDSKGYCQAYHTTIDSIDYFANADCKCITIGGEISIDSGNYWEYCREYECKQQGMSKYEPNLKWIVVGVLFGGPCLLRVISTCMIHQRSLNDKVFYSVIISLALIHLSFLFITLVMGGVGSLVVAEGINIIFAMFLITYLLYLNCKAEYDKHGDIPIYHDDDEEDEEEDIDSIHVHQSIKIKKSKSNISDLFPVLDSHDKIDEGVTSSSELLDEKFKQHIDHEKFTYINIDTIDEDAIHHNFIEELDSNEKKKN